MNRETTCDTLRSKHATGIIGADASLTYVVLKAIAERDKQRQDRSRTGLWKKIKTLINPLEWNR